MMKGRVSGFQSRVHVRRYGNACLLDPMGGLKYHPILKPTAPSSLFMFHQG